MSDYKGGQIIVVKQNFGIYRNNIHYFEGEHFRVITYNQSNLYVARAKVIVKVKDSLVEIGEERLFSIEEIENNFIKYEEWMCLHREEQIKSILDE